MTDKLNTALSNVEVSYKDLVEIVNDMLANIIGPINDLVGEINYNINSLSIDQIRDYILRLQLKAFELCETKEKSAMKAELAEALQKEKYAVSFNGAEGTAAVKGNIATVESSGEIASEALYNLAANLLKTKLDQLHRLVAALSSILMSKGQEMKFMNFGTTNEIPSTTNSRMTLNEVLK